VNSVNRFTGRVGTQNRDPEQQIPDYHNVTDAQYYLLPPGAQQQVLFNEADNDLRERQEAAKREEEARQTRLAELNIKVLDFVSNPPKSNQKLRDQMKAERQAVQLKRQKIEQERQAAQLKRQDKQRRDQDHARD
jgi:hypothetical protein